MIKFFVDKFYDQFRHRVRVSEEVWNEVVIPHDDILKGYCTLALPRRIFMSYYNNKLPVKLEEMDAEEKRKLKIFVNKLLPEHTPEFRLEACKIIFTLNQLL